MNDVTEVAEVTNEKYFSSENELKYMGSSQFKNFMSCEARALAQVRGEYKPEPSIALLTGSYVDSHFEKTLDIFKSQHPELFKQNGDLKSEYRQAEYIIERVTRDKMFMKYMSGESQIVKTGEIEGVPFKIKIDSYHPGKAIVDLKVMRDFSPVYKEGEGRLNFIEAWGYDIQAAIYQAIEGNNLPFFIAAVTKEKEPDMAIINIDQDSLAVALEIVKSNAVRFNDLKKGIGVPIRCEHCDYCKKTKVLNRVITMEELDND